MLCPISTENFVSPRTSLSPDGLVASFHHLCKRGAHKFWRSGLERNDLEQVAAIGLIKAARRYDATSPTPFEAYAWLMIVGELMHHVRDSERPIRIPRRLQSLERAFARTHDGLLATLGREPSDAELAEALGVLVPAITEMRQARALAVPLRIDDSGADRLAVQSPLGLEDRMLVDDAFAALTQTERHVIAGIYLLGLTQLEVARRLAVSAKRVSRIHRAALGRMRQACLS
jgi:RNA polymerase sigma-B factor